MGALPLAASHKFKLSSETTLDKHSCWLLRKLSLQGRGTVIEACSGSPDALRPILSGQCPQQEAILAGVGSAVIDRADCSPAGLLRHCRAKMAVIRLDGTAFLKLMSQLQNRTFAKSSACTAR